MDTRSARKSGRLWTSADAAKAFRVGVSSIKRWTDEGELESVRTPGGHRRYTPMALLRFASLRGLRTDLLPRVSELETRAALPPPADITLYEALRTGNAAAVRSLVTPRVESLPKRAAFLDRVVGDALREIGYRWERGDLTVDEEHRASSMITEELDRLRPAEPEAGKLALLACPPNEQHAIPLHLIRLILEWMDWQTDLLGANLPWEALQHAIGKKSPQLVLLSARSSDPFLSQSFTRLADECKRRGIDLAIGGEWARGGTGVAEDFARFRTLRGFERWLRRRANRPD